MENLPFWEGSFCQEEMYVMKKLWNGYQRHKDTVLILTGLLVVSMIILPYLVLGEGSYVQVHDQLDGEVLNYIYQARYLGQGMTIPQFMNGMDKAAMLPPAPIGVLLYRIFSPFMAFALMHWLCIVVGFLGMYCLEKRLGLTAELSWVVACLFCYIPFYPVYGLAALGQPMLVLCGLRLWNGDKKGGFSGKLWETLLGIALYGAGSSLTLIGYVWVGLGLIWVLVLAVQSYFGKKQWNERKAALLRVSSGVLMLLGVYLVTNLSLLRSLTDGGFTTHRQEMVLRALENPVSQLRELFFTGGAYSPVYSPGILAGLIVLTVAFTILQFKEGKWKRENRLKVFLMAAWKLVGVIFCATLLAVLWNCSYVVELRQVIGGMVTYFQADRVYWCFPFAWMLVLGFALQGIWQIVCMPGAERTIGKAAAVICCVALIAIEGLQILRDSTLNKNIRLMLSEDYYQVTWESIYMEDVFAQIDETIGGDKDGYSVVSLGIYPAVALYNGYTCADGYSNNYDLAYKHLFRQIMSDELVENETSRTYFDDWGNRLYLSGAPYGINGMVPKGQAAYTDLDYDLDAMYALNIRYLLAAAPVELSAASLEKTALHLELVEGSPFSSDTSYYEVWVYRLTE